uniref:Uncharacterized protein n=1 Tax=uncultured prokaryote TaxID=198431 RepID=A0A0H5Q3A0_9ZZZZ|nr:hypothetical protein [uncultured prokaryote]
MTFIEAIYGRHPDTWYWTYRWACMDCGAHGDEHRLAAIALQAGSDHEPGCLGSNRTGPYESSEV